MRSWDESPRSTGLSGQSMFLFAAGKSARCSSDESVSHRLMAVPWVPRILDCAMEALLVLAGPVSFGRARFVPVPVPVRRILVLPAD